MNFYLVEIEAFNRDMAEPRTLHLMVAAESYYKAVHKANSVEEEENEDILSLKITQINDDSIEVNYLYLTEEVYTKILEG